MKKQLFTPAAALVLLAGSAQALAAGPLPFPHPFELSTLSGANGFVLNGIDANDSSGVSVSSAGDVNGDGVDDLIIGAPAANQSAQGSAGESYVVFGAPGLGASGAINLSSLNGANGFVLNGIDANDLSGRSVSSAGDVNGDGFDDLVIGARRADPNGQVGAGESYVVFGTANIGAGGALNLSSLTGANGFVLNGITSNDQSGRSVSSAGDVNGDGVDDLLIGASYADPNGQSYAGESYVVFGAANLGAGGILNLSLLNGANGFALNGIGANDRSGWSVSSAGDVNGDGFADLIIGAYGASPNGQTQAGESYVVFGAAGVGASGVVNLSTLSGSNGFAINGIDAHDNSGVSVSSAGDVNGDGIDDLIIGAPYANPNGQSVAGESYVVYGANNLGAGGVFNLSSLNGANGFVINGINANDRSGVSVSSAGDVNGDGIADLVIGAVFADPNGMGDAGESYVVFGAANLGVGGVINLSSLNGANGFVINGINVNDRSGRSVSSAGDLNGDGVADLIIGAHYASPNGQPHAGESYVVFGRLGNVWTNPAGGFFDTPSNWLRGVVPSGGSVVINPSLGVNVTGPSGAVFIDDLTLGATLGRTTLDLQPLSLVSVAQPFTIPATGALAGDGTFAAQATFTNNGLIEPGAMSLIAASGLTNNADINLVSLSSPPALNSLEIFGALSNGTAGSLFLRGAANLETTGGLTNSGTASFTLVDANVHGPITNAGVTDGAGGFTPLGLISISGASSVVLTDDLLNQSDIILTADSSLFILGSLTGNGVAGPGGGAGGPVFIEGAFNPGFPVATSVAHFGGDLNLGSASVTTIEIGGTIAGAGHDQVTSGASLAAGGALDVTLVNGFAPQQGDIFTVMTAASGVSGAFTAFTAPALPGDLQWRLRTEANAVRLVVTVPSDLDGDGKVNAFDLATLVGSWGVCPPAPNACDADFNGDGVVRGFDLAQLIGSWAP